jgi:hypothetical protein
MATLDQVMNLKNYTLVEIGGETLTLSGTDKWMLVVIYLLNQRNQRTSFKNLSRLSGFTTGTCIRRCGRCSPCRCWLICARSSLPGKSSFCPVTPWPRPSVTPRASGRNSMCSPVTEHYAVQVKGCLRAAHVRGSVLPPSMQTLSVRHQLRQCDAGYDA